MDTPKKDKEINENAEPTEDKIVSFTIKRWVIYIFIGFFIGLFSGYIVWGQNTTASPALVSESNSNLDDGGEEEKMFLRLIRYQMLREQMKRVQMKR